MYFADYKCNNCECIFEVSKVRIVDDFPEDSECPDCLSTDNRRSYVPTTFSISQGSLGNSKNGYNSSHTYHPNAIVGRVKGKTIKTTKG